MTSECLLKRGQSIVFDGDSLTNRQRMGDQYTWSYLRMCNWHETWAHRVEDWLFCNRPDLNLKFSNVAIAGQTCRDLIARVDEFVLPRKPDWVLMTLGGNDVAQGIPPRELKATMRDYFQRIADSSGGRCALVSGWKSCPNCPEGLRNQSARHKRFDGAVRDVFEDCGGLWIDAGTALQKNARLLAKQWPDHTIYSGADSHINAVGNMIIATQVLQGLGMLKVCT